MVFDFWFDFASSYSYLTIQRISKVAKSENIAISWKPFLLGPIFAAQGWDTSPFNIYQAKGKFMLRDMQRRANLYGLPFCKDAPLPVNSVEATRLAIAALHSDCYSKKAPELCQKISLALWGDGQDISDKTILKEIIQSLNIDYQKLQSIAQSDATKPILRENTQNAINNGIFGAPSYTVKNTLNCSSVELFWGDDQLEDAITWLKNGNL